MLMSILYFAECRFALATLWSLRKALMFSTQLQVCMAFTGFHLFFQEEFPESGAAVN